MSRNELNTVITAGSSYLDIDAYACCVAMKELLELKGERAVACSSAVYNYSVAKSLIEEGQVLNTLPDDADASGAKYIIVDVSDPDYIKDSVPLDRVSEVYDHHVGFEEYWKTRIGDKCCIEFIGAAATLIYREWKKADLQGRMTPATARLLIAAILDNTLNLTSSNTTDEDIEAFRELCIMGNADEEWCSSYFYEVQSSVESDLNNALFGDIKRITNNSVLPERVAQLCVWDAGQLLERLPDIRKWFSESPESWMINVIDVKHQISYFVCDSFDHQNEISKVFSVRFENGVAKNNISYLRKEIIKKTISYK